MFVVQGVHPPASHSQTIYRTGNYLLQLQHLIAKLTPCFKLKVTGNRFSALLEKLNLLSINITTPYQLMLQPKNGIKQMPLTN